MEAALSIYLENFATTLGSREQLAIAEFADALLAIPKTLAVNAAQVRPRSACEPLLPAADCWLHHARPSLTARPPEEAKIKDVQSSVVSALPHVPARLIYQQNASFCGHNQPHSANCLIASGVFHVVGKLLSMLSRLQS